MKHGAASLRITKQSEEKKKTNLSSYVCLLLHPELGEVHLKTLMQTPIREQQGPLENIDTWEKAIEASYCCIPVWGRYSQN